MKFLKLFGALALLLSFPVFSDIVTAPVHYPDGYDCGCEVFCDTTTGICEFDGDDCEGCTYSADEGDSGWGNFEAWCDCYEGDFEDSPTAVNARQSAVLVYSSFNSSQTSALSTGTLGTSEGTFADKEVVFVIDAETPHTNEVEIRPTWCK